jgi:hypothetical protein
LKNRILQKSKENSPHLVVVGMGLSGIDFILRWQKKVKQSDVTFFEESGFTPLLLDAFFSLKGKTLTSICEDPSYYHVDNIKVRFNSSSVKDINTRDNKIYHSTGYTSYDFLLIIHEFDQIRIVANNNYYNHPSFFKLSNNFENEEVTEKEIAIEGHDLLTLALAIKFLNEGLKPTIYCDKSRLAMGEIPKEEAWLIGKYFKNLGIGIKFEKRFFEKLPNGLSQICVKENSNKLSQPINSSLMEYGEMPLLTRLQLEEFYPVRVVRKNSKHCTDVVSIREKSAVDINEKGEALDGYSVDQRKNKCEREGVLFNQYVFKELSWQTYGEISTKWGTDTQNFYWEHPEGGISFRMHYRKMDFSIKGIACLGISFNKTFIVNALQSNCKAYDFIDRIDEGMERNEYSFKVYPLIKKSFDVEFKKNIKSHRSSLIKRVFSKFF